jgi:hypothetical protein
LLALRRYSGWVAVDVSRKQGFYLARSYNRETNNIHRASYNDRPPTYSTIPVAQLYYEDDNSLSIVYDTPTQTLYVTDLASPSNVYVFNVTGTDCPQGDNSSSASTPASSALWSSLLSLSPSSSPLPELVCLA